jgi:hypothetical protein
MGVATTGEISGKSIILNLALPAIIAAKVSFCADLIESVIASLCIQRALLFWHE